MWYWKIDATCIAQFDTEEEAVRELEDLRAKGEECTIQHGDKEIPVKVSWISVEYEDEENPCP